MGQRDRAWIEELRALVRTSAQSLRERLDSMAPEQVASIMGIAASEITSYQSLIPQGDDDDASDASEGRSDTQDGGQRAKVAGARRKARRPRKTLAPRASTAPVDPSREPPSQ